MNKGQKDNAKGQQTPEAEKHLCFFISVCTFQKEEI